MHSFDVDLITIAALKITTLVCQSVHNEFHHFAILHCSYLGLVMYLGVLLKFNLLSFWLFKLFSDIFCRTDIQTNPLLEAPCRSLASLFRVEWVVLLFINFFGSTQ